MEDKKEKVEPKPYPVRPLLKDKELLKDPRLASIFTGKEEIKKLSEKGKKFLSRDAGLNEEAAEEYSIFAGIGLAAEEAEKDKAKSEETDTKKFITSRQMPIKERLVRMSERIPQMSDVPSIFDKSKEETDKAIDAL